MRNCSKYDCAYINKPYCTLRPISSITPCPRFSCPPPQHFCPTNSFQDEGNFCPNFCSPNNLNPPLKNSCAPQCNNLIWFLGGFSYGANRVKRSIKTDEF